MPDKNITMTLDQTSLAQGFAALILKELEPEQRDNILRQAITHIIEAPEDRYGRHQPSVLEQAFTTALAELANRVAAEIVESNPAYRARVHAEVTWALDDLINGDGTVLRTTVAQAITKAIMS